MLRYAPESGLPAAVNVAPKKVKPQKGSLDLLGKPPKPAPEGWAMLAADAGVCENQLRDLVALIDLLPEGPAIRGTLTDLDLARALVYDGEAYDLIDQFSLPAGPGCAPEALAIQAEAQAAKMQRITAQIYAAHPGGLFLGPDVAYHVVPPGNGNGNGNGNGDLAKILPWALGGVALFLLLR